MRVDVERGSSPEQPESSPAQPTTPLEEVLRGLTRWNTRALICEHLAQYTADAFRGGEASSPTKLLQMPDGSKHRADTADVLEIEAELRRLGSDARRALAALKGAAVVVDPAAVQRPDAPSTPFVPAPAGEEVTSNAPANEVLRGRGERGPNGESEIWREAGKQK